MIGSLKKVGVLLHKSNLADNIIIIRLREFVKPGTLIYDSNMKELGKIIEVFGPVKAPYARVIINEKEKDYIETLLTQSTSPNRKKSRFPCYIIGGEEEKVKWRKMPRPRKGRIE